MLKIAARVSLLLMAINFAHAQTNLPGQWNGDGVSGKIQVRGVLTEGACRLDLHSSYQEIESWNAVGCAFPARWGSWHTRTL